MVQCIWGGYDHNSLAQDELYRFDFLQMSWERQSFPGAPAPRFHHSAVVVSGNVLILGGVSAENENFSFDKVPYFDFTSHKWGVLKTKGMAPEPRHGHACVSVGALVYLFGGYNQ